MRRNREFAHYALEAIKVYIKEKEDKNVEFTSDDLRNVGIAGYDGHGLTRLEVRKVIKHVGYLGKSKIYKLDDRLLGHPLSKLIGMKYHDIMKGN